MWEDNGKSELVVKWNGARSTSLKRFSICNRIENHKLFRVSEKWIVCIKAQCG